jgi:hypothetical protein
MTVRLGDAVAFAQVGIVGLDGKIELEALRLYGLPEAAPALLCGTPTLPVGQREFAVETTLDLPSLAGGATHLIDVAVQGARQGDRAEASVASSTRLIELDAFAWSNNTVRVMARNISGASFDLGGAMLSGRPRSGGYPNCGEKPTLDGGWQEPASRVANLQASSEILTSPACRLDRLTDGTSLPARNSRAWSVTMGPGDIHW